MKLKEMREGVRYRVTKGSRDTLEVGDAVWMEMRDLCLLKGGWLRYENWNRLKAEVEIDFDYHKRQIALAKQTIKTHTKIIKDKK